MWREWATKLIMERVFPLYSYTPLQNPELLVEPKAIVACYRLEAKKYRNVCLASDKVKHIKLHRH
jgi:hypothetical protein